MFSLREDSPQLGRDDINKITKLMTLPLKKHQNTSINAMLSLEKENKIIIEAESSLLKNEILFKDDLVANPYRMFNLRDRNLNFKMNKFEISTNFGILADKVGAGKTYEILGMICHTLEPIDNPKIISSSYNSMIKWHDNEKNIKTNLIIVPHNLTTQWKKAIEYTKLNHYIINKRAHIDFLKSANNIYEEESSDSELDIHRNQCIEHYDLLLISSTMFTDFIDKFPNVKWARIIIDEITSIKLPVNFDMRANFVWYITATPSGIRYVSRSYIKQTISGIQQSILNRIIIKNDDDYVSKSMDLPQFNQIIIKCNTPRGLCIMREFIPRDVINMLNAGNMKDAITRLNCNVDTEDNIFKVLTNKLEKDIHNTKLSLEFEEKARYVDKKAHDEKLKNLKNQLSSLEVKYNTIKQRISNFQDENCPICLDTVTNPAIVPCCNNLFCLQCLTNIINSSCPMCRQFLNLKDINVISKDHKTPKKDPNKLLSKHENLVNIIKKKPNGKFLVFSNYDNANENIAKILEKERITYAKIAGNISVINKTIERFSNGTVKVLLLNATNYGSGLNLQMASDIIIYHELDNELETQVIGRAHRLGRTEPLNIFYLMYDHEKSNCTNPTLDMDIYNFEDEENIIDN